MLITRPHPRFTIRGPNAREQRNGPLRFVSITASEVVLRQILDRAADIDAGVVDQDVDGTELGLDLRGQSLDVARSGHVRHERLGPPSGRRRDRRPPPADSSRASARRGDVGAGLGQRRRHGHAEPARAAGDERDLAVETEGLENMRCAI